MVPAVGLAKRNSAAMTLLPGDVIATGTSVDVDIGFTPPKFLKPGDVVRALPSAAWAN